MEFDISFDLPPNLLPTDFVAIDLELFGAEKKKLHRPTTGEFACLSICYKPDLVHILTDKKQVREALDNLQDATWIFHNASFDIKQLRRWTEILPRKKLWDTMVIERIMCGGLYEGDGYSLEAVSRRRLDYRMDKKIRDSFENATVLTDEQIRYCAEDSVITLLVCKAQQKEMTKNDFNVWKNIDRGALFALLDFQGFRLNVEGWKELAQRNSERANELAKGFDFNPASPIQVKQVLIKNGFRGLKDTQEPTLQKAMLKYPDKKAVEITKKVLECRTFAKRASTYGQKFLDDYLEHDGENVYSIHAHYWVVGTEHGRTASSNPAMQTIIARDTDEFRKQFIARPGHKLIVVDMGQQETRIAAYVSQDKALMEILQDIKQDVFIGMAKMIYKKDITKDDPFRKQVKNTAYGINYGMSAEGMADRYGMTLDEAEEAIHLYFKTFSGFHGWVMQQRQKTNYVETIAGRRVWLNPYSMQCERNALNDPISGSAADQMKMALGNIHQKWHDEIPEVFGFPCVGYIHDELIFDVPAMHAEKVVKFVQREMISAAELMCPGVPFTATPKICDNWAEGK